MSKEEIKGLIEEVFDERIKSAVTGLSSEREALDDKINLETKEGIAVRKELQKRVVRLDSLIEILKSLKQT